MTQVVPFSADTVRWVTERALGLQKPTVISEDSLFVDPS